MALVARAGWVVFCYITPHSAGFAIPAAIFLSTRADFPEKLSPSGPLRMKLDERLARGWRVMDWGIFLRELLLLTVSPRVAGWQTMARLGDVG